MARVTAAHVEARRDQILNAAWSTFARKGYHRVTMAEIAREAGLSAGALYRYFPGKEAILLAINERSQEMGRALVEAAVRSHAGGPLDALEVLAATMLSFFLEDDFETISLVNIEVWPEVIRNPELRKGMRNELSFWRQAVSALLRDAQTRGELRPEVDAEALTTVFMCAWEGLRHYRLVDPTSFSPQAILDVLQPFLVDGARSGRLVLDGTAERLSPPWPAAAAASPGPRAAKAARP